MDLNKSVGFALRKITTEQFAIIKDAFIEGKIINLNTGFTFGINRKSNIVVVMSKISFEQKNKPFIILEVGCHFEIDENTWKSFKEGKSFLFPREFITHLSMLTIGTVRGVLHAKTENTNFNSYFLPTINVTAIIKEDIKIE